MRESVPLMILAAVGSLYATTGLADSCHGPSAPSAFPGAHNVAIEVMQKIATKFNTLLRAYRLTTNGMTSDRTVRPAGAGHTKFGRSHLRSPPTQC